MIFYYIIFILSFLCLRKARFNYEDEIQYKQWIISSLVILLIPAAIRDISVGRDVSVYQIPLFTFAKNSNSLYEYMINAYGWVQEIGYDLLFYFSAKISGSINMVFFVEELIALTPIYYVIWHYRDKVLPELSLGVYLILFYLNTYNTIRQNLAIGFVLYGIVKWEERAYHKYFIALIIAMSFHISSIIALIFPFIIYLCGRESENHYKRFIYNAGIMAGLSGISLLYKKIFIFIGMILPFLPRKYFSDEHYLNSESFNLPMTDFLICIISIVILLCVRWNRPEIERWINFLVIVSIIYFTGLYIQASTDFAGRIYWYFRIFWIFSIPIGIDIFKPDFVNRSTFSIVTFILLGGYAYYIHAINNVSGVIPYKVASF